MQEIAEVPNASSTPPAAHANWIVNATLLWDNRRLLMRVTGIALVLSAAIAFLIPKQYDSVARLMPPDQQGSGAALLAAVAGRSLGGLGSLGGFASGLLGARSSSALYIDLLHSRTLSDRIIERFDLQKVYGKRYRVDTVKYLVRHTTVVDDKKSGVITLTFSDSDPVRAREIAQAYVEELNAILTTSNTSSARTEREFVERRLATVKEQLHNAEKALSDFSSVNTTLDIKEQTQAMVGASAKLQGELIVAQSELGSLEQIYGDENVRVRATRARIASLKHDLSRLSGNSAALPSDGDIKSVLVDNSSLYPSLRQLPRLAVPYAGLYRSVRIQEAVFELLSQEYEAARIQEAKDTPVVSVFDSPLVAEKKSFPPRLLVILGLTAFADVIACCYVILRHLWGSLAESDPRRRLAAQMAASFMTLRPHTRPAEVSR